MLVLFEFLLPVHTMQQVPITYFHVEFCDSSSSFHRCLWIVCITQQMAFLPWLLLILCLPHSVGWPFKYLFFQELQKMFWQRQLNPFHVVEFQTGAILMLIQVGWLEKKQQPQYNHSSQPPPSSESSRICWCQVLVVYSSHCSRLLHMML